MFRQRGSLSVPSPGHSRIDQFNQAVMSATCFFEGGVEVLTLMSPSCYRGLSTVAAASAARAATNPSKTGTKKRRQTQSAGWSSPPTRAPYHTSLLRTRRACTPIQYRRRPRTIPADGRSSIPCLPLRPRPNLRPQPKHSRLHDPVLQVS